MPKWLDATWYEGRPGPGHIVLDGDSDPRTARGIAAPTFRPVFILAKMAGWIKIPLGVEVGLDPNDIVLDGDPAPSPT